MNMKKLLLLTLVFTLMLFTSCNEPQGRDRVITDNNGDTLRIVKSNNLEYYSLERSLGNKDSLFFFIDKVGNHQNIFLSDGKRVVSFDHDPDCPCLKNKWEETDY